jgi:hypothetical protein
MDMALTINIKPQEISSFTCNVEITVPVDDVIEIVKRHDIGGSFSKIAPIRELRDQFCVNGQGAISLRDAKEMVEAVMVQLGIPAQLG